MNIDDALARYDGAGGGSVGGIDDALQRHEQANAVDPIDAALARSAAPISDAESGARIGSLVGDLLAGKNAFDNPAAQDWYKQHAAEADVQTGIPSAWTPEDTDNAITYGVPAAALATGFALPAMGAVGTLAAGVLTGGAARGTSAALRGQDVSGAVLDPEGIAWDAGLSGIPLALQGAKAGGQAIWNATPSSIREPVANAASSAASYVGGKASDAVTSLLRRYARNTPGLGEQLIEDRPVNIEDIFTGRRPEPRVDLARERIAGTPSSGTRTRMDSIIDKTAGEARLLRSLGDDDLAEQIELANNIERRLTNYFGPMTDDAVLPLASGPVADSASVPLSTRVVDVVEGGHPLTGEGQGAQAARIADMLRRPDIYDPELQRLADPMRREMSDLAEAGTRANVYDELKGTGSRARAMELHDQGVNTVPIGGTDDDPARWFAERQLVQDGKYYPHQPVPDPLAPDISEAVGIERIMTANPELSYAQAQRQLGSLRTGAATGKARLAEEGVEYNKYAPEVIPGHVRADVHRIANAHAFGGEPVKIKVSVANGGQEIIVGKQAADQLKDLANRGDWRAYNAYEKALAGRHMDQAGDPDLKAWLSGTARMALPRAFLTQIGQMPTGAIMHGGVKGMARGFAEVEANPALRDIFRVGAQSHEFTDYAARAVGADAVDSAAPFMKQAENLLRGPASYVAVPMVKDTAKEAAAMLQANQPFSRSLVKRAAEMGTTPEALGTEFLSTDGMLSHATWLDTIQRLTNRWQHTQGVGEIPSWARTQAGAAAAQFKMFGLKQSQLVYDDIVQPILEGLRTGDKSLRDLGAARAGRMIYMGLPANAGAAGLRSLASGRLPTKVGMLRSAISGPTGIVGDVGCAAADTVSGHRYGDDEFRSVREIPGLSVPIDTTRDLLAAFSNPGGAAEAAARLGGLYDARIPLYATPVVNLTREFLAPAKR